MMPDVNPLGGITEVMTQRGHEQVVFVADAASGLRAVIAIHSTALGPSLGGVRFWHYAEERDAVTDVLRLSEAMSLKASMAGLPQGGGKTVVMLPEPEASHPEPMLRALGRAVNELGGRYLAAEDVGATQHDMDVMATVTPWVTGVDPADGGSGDPSPVTAVGVLAAMRAVAEALDGETSLAGRRVAVQGVGHVGSHLVGLLIDAGASVVVGEANDARLRMVADRYPIEVVAPDDVLATRCDILAPCALGAVLNERTVPLLECQAVCGAANNQLADDSIGDQLAERGVLYAPDYVANAGGIINLAEEFTGYDHDRALKRAAGIEDTMRTVLSRATTEGSVPSRVADAMARERIVQEGAGRRWEPGDAAAWTDGAPLTTLRPRMR